MMAFPANQVKAPKVLGWSHGSDDYRCRLAVKSHDTDALMHQSDDL
jgi:hypothetical protein